MTDQAEELLRALVKLGAEISIVSTNAMPATIKRKRGYAKDLQALANNVNATIGLLRSATIE